MPLESATHISDLDASNPVGSTDKVQTLDNHIRLVKNVLKTDFAGITGAVTATHDELNILDGATLSVAELNTLDGITATVTELNVLDGITATLSDLNALHGGTLTAANGSALTNLTAANITGSHTLPDGVLSTNVPLLDAANVFTVSQSISGTNLGVSFTDGTRTGQLTTTNFGPDFLLWTTSAHGLYFGTNSTVRAIIDSSGNFDFKAGTVTTNNASATEVGFKGVAPTDETGNYTFVLSDAGRCRSYGGAGGHTFTVPADGTVAFPLGTVLTIANRTTSPLSIAVTTDTLRLAGTSSTGTRTLAQYGLATLIKMPGPFWLVSGAGVS